MDKVQFCEVVKNFSAITAEESKELSKLVDLYPYSQVIQHLATRAAKDNNLTTAEEQLHKSAIYATNRSVLKKVITVPRSERKRVIEKIASEIREQTQDNKTAPSLEKSTIEEVKAAPQENKSTPQSNELLIDENKSVPIISIRSKKTGDALVKELMTDLNKLQKLKHQFSESLSKFQKSQSIQQETAKKEKVVKSPTSKPTVPLKTKKISSTSKPNEPIATAKKKPKPVPQENLISEIAVKKKELPIEGPLQKEQHKIIDNFIKTPPNLKKGLKTEGPNMPDLSESSTFISDQVVSETLVEILIKQGKNDKAIEMLKKLIWKYPQKKAYFAARIEDLKK